MSGRHVLIASAVIASALAVSAPAQAASSFTGNGSQNITDGTGVFSDAAIPEGLFTDTIEFSVSSSGLADVSAVYLEFAVTGLSNLTGTFNGESFDFVNVAGNIFAGGISQSVSAGKQTITISGNSGGNGSYGGTVNFAAVPELATWLMMIAGVGFTGFAMRGRKVAPKVNYAF